MTLTIEVHHTGSLYEIDALLKKGNGEIDVIGIYIQLLCASALK